MGFRGSVTPSADTLDTGGVNQRIVIGSDGRLLLYPDDYQDPAFPFAPGELSASVAVDGSGNTTVSTLLAAPPDPVSGFQAQLILGWTYAAIQGPNLLALNVSEVTVPKPIKSGDAAQFTDGGWVALTLGTGVTAGTRGVRHRLLNGVCYFNIGALSNGWAANQLVATLPAGARPAASTSLVAAYAGFGQYTELLIGTDGTIKATNASSAGTGVGLTASGSFPLG